MWISLNGNDWQIKDYYGEDWRWRDAHKPNSRDTRFWRKSTVPGSVLNDLWACGEIVNPYFELNSLLIEWIPARTWLYKKTFLVGENLRGRRIQLCFEGVDYAAEFFLNGELLGRHVGMYTPASFDVSDKLIFGADNLLAVVIEPAPHEQPQVGRTSKVWTHKSRMTYWWDFCPRMVHIGIWDGVYLEATDKVRIIDVFVRPELTDDFQHAQITASIELDAAQPQTITLETAIRLNNEIITQQQMFCNLGEGQTTINVPLSVDQPHLWWPNGHGDQPLYAMEVRASGTDSRTVRFGIRKIELKANENADANALPYTFVVNGRKIYVKGWNWVPLDVIYGVERPDKLEHLFRLVQHAHVNLLRVWGGGLIEKEAFYDLADRLGILVWQEFILSSSGIDNYPSDGREYTAMLMREAEQIIPRKRNHPSLALWCGGNELTTDETIPLDDRHPALATLHTTVARLDPDRLWLPTSPTGPVFGNTLENIKRDPNSLHDVHGPWEFQGVSGQCNLYNASTSLFHSEFGVEGITNLKTLNATIALNHQQPVSLENVYWQHLGAWWVKLPMWRETFGEITDMEMLVRATQLMQAEGLRYALEANRRRQYQNSGTLPWQFNEPYPMAACTSAVDYYGQAKPSYYAVARVYAPLHISAKFTTLAWEGEDHFEAEIWVSSDSELALDARLNVRLIGMSGQVYHEQFMRITIPVNRSASITSIEQPLDGLDDIFFLDLDLLTDANQPLSSNRYIFTKAIDLAPLLHVSPTLVRVEKELRGDDWTLAIRNIGDQTALFIWLEDSRSLGASGFAEFSDNHFCLFPQEMRQIVVSWNNDSAEIRRVVISGWNVMPIAL
jgi:beta-mannosidase